METEPVTMFANMTKDQRRTARALLEGYGVAVPDDHIKNVGVRGDGTFCLRIVTVTMRNDGKAGRFVPLGSALADLRGIA